MNDVPTPESCCPSCSYKVNSASALTSGEPVQPTPGDFSICLNCGAALRFQNDLTLRIMEPEEMTELEPENIMLLKRAQDFIRQRGPIP